MFTRCISLDIYHICICSSYIEVYWVYTIHSAMNATGALLYCGYIVIQHHDIPFLQYRPFSYIFACENGLHWTVRAEHDFISWYMLKIPPWTTVYNHFIIYKSHSIRWRPAINLWISDVAFSKKALTANRICQLLWHTVSPSLTFIKDVHSEHVLEFIQTNFQSNIVQWSSHCLESNMGIETAHSFKFTCSIIPWKLFCKEGRS